MPTKKPKARKGWVFSPPKPSKPKVDDATKAEVERKADELIESFLKPEFVKPPPEGTEWNYIVDIYGKWYRSYFYLCAKYRCPAPNCITEFFETKFTRLEYVGSGKFNLAFMRHTEQWAETEEGLCLEECLDKIRNDSMYQP
jgi:hypothetical protein